MGGALCEDITTTLFRNRAPLQTACQFFDYSLKLEIKPEDFGEALEAVSSVLVKPQQPFTASQIGRLVSAVVENDTVKYMEFIHAFEVFDSGATSEPSAKGGQEAAQAKCLLRKSTLRCVASDIS